MIAKNRTIRKLRNVNDEEWKPIPRTDNMYEVSNYGRIKSYFYNKVNGRIMQPGNIRGFLVVNIRINGKTKTHYVHKLVAEEFVSKKNNNETVVIHLDWNKVNNHFINLKWTNRDDSYKRIHSRMRAEGNIKSKIITRTRLTSEDVIILKTMIKRGIRKKIIARQISRIKRTQPWNDIEVMNIDTSHKNLEKIHKD